MQARQAAADVMAQASSLTTPQGQGSDGAPASAPASTQPMSKDPWWIWLGVAFVAVYSGYFGAGAGTCALAVLDAGKIGPFHQINALKTLIGTGANISASVIFIVRGVVDWPAAILLCVGCFIGGYIASMTSGDFTLTGFSSDTAIANAANGTFTMSSGEVFGYGESDNGKAIISKALADFNGLKVGDEITVTNPSDTSTTYTFTIGGIYKNSTSSNTSAMGPMGGTSQDADTTANDDDTTTTTQLSYTYVLGSADDYETFASDVRKAGLDDTCTVQSADVENHESSLVPLDNLAKFALTLLIVVLAVGAVVLNLFNICERKYEVGVLTAIGVKKVKVAAQFAIELLIVTMCGIALGVAGGAVASVPVSNQLRLLAGDPDRQPGGAVRSRRRHGRRSRQQL